MIHKKYEQALLAAEADASQVEQVLMNLYVNAWQAMPGGGHIYLETANVVVTESDGYSLNGEAAGIISRGCNIFQSTDR